MKNLSQQLLYSLQEIKGFDEEAFKEAHLHSAGISVRVHPLKRNSLFDNNERVPWCANGFYLKERPVFTLDPAYHGGAYYVQEASSMFLGHLLKDILQDRKGLRVLDLCAAPGGKSTLIASLLDRESLLVSNDVIRSRASILEENMDRWGYMNTWVTSNDPRDFGKLVGYFDVIVVDAPCSGSGLFRKDKRALDEWSEANVELCSQRQQRILADVWPALKQDGILVYATCSYSPQEDEQVLNWLGEEFDVEGVVVSVPEEWGIVSVYAGGLAGYRFFPDKVKGEGFFIATVRKKEAVETVRYPKFKPENDTRIRQQAAYLLQQNDLVFIQAANENYNTIISQHQPDLHLLQKTLYLRKTGLDVGSPTQKEWIPAHTVALSVDVSDVISVISVNKEQALYFLKKDDFGIIPPKGWYMIRYNGLGLGWVKSLGNRVNNYLPKNWRIRMEIPGEDWA